MNNTHRLEKLRLADAPDKTRVWTKLVNGTSWKCNLSVLWLAKYLYVVDDGIHVKERKHFAEHGEIYYYSSSQKKCVLTRNPTFDADIIYCITPPKTQWYELEENIGKLIFVGDSQVKEHQRVAVFLDFKVNNPFPFVTYDGEEFQYAQLIDHDELAKESPDVQ